MNRRQALALVKGARVVIWQGQPGEARGTVEVPKTVHIRWDDGELTWIHPNDFANVAEYGTNDGIIYGTVADDLR